MQRVQKWFEASSRQQQVGVWGCMGQPFLQYQLGPEQQPAGEEEQQPAGEEEQQPAGEQRMCRQAAALVQSRPMKEKQHSDGLRAGQRDKFCKFLQTGPFAASVCRYISHEDEGTESETTAMRTNVCLAC